MEQWSRLLLIQIISDNRLFTQNKKRLDSSLQTRKNENIWATRLDSMNLLPRITFVPLKKGKKNICFHCLFVVGRPPGPGLIGRFVRGLWTIPTNLDHTRKKKHNFRPVHRHIEPKAHPQAQFTAHPIALRVRLLQSPRAGNPKFAQNLPLRVSPPPPPSPFPKSPKP